MKTLCRCYTSIEAHLLKGLLEQQGIRVTLLGEALFGAIGELPVNEAQIQVQIDEDNWAKGMSIYQDFIAKPCSKDNVFCKNCKEENPSEFDICWRCGEDLG